MAQTKVKLISDGVIVQSNLHASHGITTAHIGEGSNLYYTDARSRAAISVSGNALSYNSSTGVITSNFEESPTFTGNVVINGTLGVGETSPSSYFSPDLVVKASADLGGITIRSNATSHNNYLMFADGTSGNERFRGFINYDHANDKLNLASAASVGLTIDSSQNVGIGTTNPQTALTLPQGSGAANKISWYDATPNFAASIYANSSNDSLTFATKNSSNVETTAMVININQNVGIGTTSPSANLHVQDTSTATLKVITTGVADASVNIQGYDAGVHIGDATNGLRWAIWNDGPSTSSSLKFGSYALGTWYNNSSQVVTMTSDGKVGIKETAPAAKLQVSGDRDGTSEYVAILGEDGGATGAANSASTSPVHKTLITGYGIPYSGQSNARLTTVGFLEFDSTPGWTGNQRNWALTSGYDMGGTNGPKFAILMGDAQNVEPQLGTNGAVGTGDGANTRVAAYWKNTGDMVLPEGSLTVNDGVYVGGSAAANKLDDYEEGTWTPQIYYQNSTDQANATNVVQQGKYTKIGNLVFVQFRLDFSQSSSSPVNDNIGVKNLPFAGANNHYAGGGNMITSDSSSNGYNFALPNAGSTIAVLNNSGNIGNYGDQFGSGSGKYIRGSFTYMAQ